MIIPVVREEITIQRLLPVEELRVKKEVVEHHEPQVVNILREETNITRVAKNKNVNRSGREG